MGSGKTEWVLASSLIVWGWGNKLVWNGGNWGPRVSLEELDNRVAIYEVLSYYREFKTVDTLLL